MKKQFKKAVLTVGRPFWKRLSPKFYARIDKRIDMRLAQSETGWNQHVPAFLNAVSSVQAFSRDLAQSKQSQQNDIAQLQGQVAVTREALQAQSLLLQAQSSVLEQVRGEIAKLWPATDSTYASVGKAFERMEFIRREIMFEMRYGGSAVQSGDRHDSVHPHVVNPEKVSAAQKTGIRLNLGSGHVPLEGYINVDMRELPGVDIVAEVANLPFEPASLKEISSAHLLEHFPQEELARRLLPYWCGLLVPGGVFHAIVPDGEAMLAGVAAGTYSFEEFREVLFGAQDYEGDFHYNLLRPDSLSHLLERSGFEDIYISARARRNGKCFEFEITAIKQSALREPARVLSAVPTSAGE